MCLPPPGSNQALAQCCKVSLVLSPPSAPHTVVSMNPFTWRKHFSESSNNSQARNFLSQPPSPHRPLPPEKLPVPMVNTQNQTEIHSLRPFVSRHTHTSPKLWHQTNFFTPAPHPVSTFSKSHENVKHYQRKEFSHPFYSGSSVSFAYARKSDGWYEWHLKVGDAEEKNHFTLFSKKPKFSIFRLRRYQQHLSHQHIRRQTTVMGGWRRVPVLVVRFFP